MRAVVDSDRPGSLVPSLVQRAPFVAALLFFAGAACGQSIPAPVEVLLSSDTTHACAGAVEMTLTLSEVNGDDSSQTFATAVSPEQLDCDFDLGVAEALWSVSAGEIPTEVLHTVTIELHDSTGLLVGVGGSEPFRASATDANDPVNIELTRAAPLGTALVDLVLEDGFGAVSGDLSIVILAGSDPIGGRSLSWPGDDSLKRPLRISGIAGTGLHLVIDLEDAAGNVVESRISETFSLGSTPDSAFATPKLNPL